VLAASSEADQIARFQAGNRPVDLRIQSWGGYVGQWDTRVWKRVVPNAEETARRRAIRTQVDSQFRAELIEARSVGGDTMMALRTIERSKRLFERFLDSWDDVYAGLEPGFIKRAPIAWFASHRHTATGENDAYAYSYLFAYEIDLEPGARTLVLPDNPAVRILAVTLAAAGPKLTPAAPLHDTQ
jgi:alpha-mannosidase